MPKYETTEAISRSESHAAWSCSILAPDRRVKGYETRLCQWTRLTTWLQRSVRRTLPPQTCPFDFLLVPLQVFRFYLAYIFFVTAMHQQTLTKFLTQFPTKLRESLVMKALDSSYLRDSETLCWIHLEIYATNVQLMAKILFTYAAACDSASRSVLQLLLDDSASVRGIKIDE